MRTKALLLGAAIGAAAILPSSAQVFSVNIVGYVNVTIATNWTLIANPLNATGGNTATNVFGFPSTSMTLYKYGVLPDTTIGYTINAYTSSKKSWAFPNMTCDPGEGMWVKNPTANPFTVTFVGEVPTGQQTINIREGFNLIASKIPQSGLLQTDLGYAPSTGPIGDTVWKWDATTQAYLTFPYSTSKKTWQGGFQPTINPGDGFWLKRGDAGIYPWSRTFNVQ